MRRWVAAAALVLVAGVGCKKEGPEPQGPGPTVIVEQPGAAPSGETGGAVEEEAAPEWGTTEVVVSDVPCTADADCVKNDCCHATSCVAIADAPDCSASVCTMECRARTMDCNGGCVCQEGRCAARLWSAPEQ